MRRHEILPEVARAIAEVEECSPHDLGYSLYTHIDTTAVRSLWESAQTDWNLTFEVPDHTVAIRGTGEILVDGEMIRTVTAQPRK